MDIKETHLDTVPLRTVQFLIGETIYVNVSPAEIAVSSPSDPTLRTDNVLYTAQTLFNGPVVYCITYQMTLSAQQTFDFTISGTSNFVRNNITSIFKAVPACLI